MRSRLSLIWLLARQGFDPNAILTRLAVRQALAGCERVLDVGCGYSMDLRWLGVPHLTGIDGHQPSLDEARRRHTHDELVFGNVCKLDEHFQPGQFDACVALDVIEHLPKEAGFKFLADMERIARKRVVLTTPNGFLPQRHAEDGDLQEHLSGWDAAEMAALGYHVTGLLGPKCLRGEYHVLRRRPKVFWGLVSFLAQILHTRRHPARAAAILCVKTKA